MAAVAGLQKLTLLDYPGHVACTVFTGGCNFRCPFCHNAPLVLPERLGSDTNEEEVLKFLKKRVGVLDGVAVTGGEPLIHKSLPEFLSKIKELGYSIKLDTNGSFPEELKKLVENGLVDRVAMDIKNSPALYADTVGIPGLDLSAVERTKDYLLSGIVDYEFRTTVVRGIHTKESLLEAAEWIRGAREYYLQQYKDSGDIIDPDNLSAFSEEEMKDLLEEVEKIVPAAKLRGV